MAAHRFREQLSRLQPAVTESVAVGPNCAFIPWPVFAGVPAQYAQVQEIYRIAAERTREQLRRYRAHRPQFSNN